MIEALVAARFRIEVCDGFLAERTAEHNLIGCY